MWNLYCEDGEETQTESRSEVTERGSRNILHVAQLNATCCPRRSLKIQSVFCAWLHFMWHSPVCGSGRLSCLSVCRVFSLVLSASGWIKDRSPSRLRWKHLLLNVLRKPKPEKTAEISQSGVVLTTSWVKRSKFGKGECRRGRESTTGLICCPLLRVLQSWGAQQLTSLLFVFLFCLVWFCACVFGPSSASSAPRTPPALRSYFHGP